MEVSLRLVRSLYSTNLWNEIGVDAQFDSNFEWSCSPLDTATNQYLAPDLGITNSEDVAAIRERLVESDTTVTYIFPIPPTLNCSGRVSAVQYCYIDANLGTTRSIFTLLSLEQDNFKFTLTNFTFVLSTPSVEKCTQVQIGSFTFAQYCCDTLLLDGPILPNQNFAFGITSFRHLLTYTNAANEPFLVEHFRFITGRLPLSIGSSVILNENDRHSDRAVRLLQFVISMYTVVSIHTTVRPTFCNSLTNQLLNLLVRVFAPHCYMN